MTDVKMMRPHVVGYRVAAMEIASGVASWARALERGLYSGDIAKCLQWDEGYEDCICAYRVGCDIAAMVAAKLYKPTILSVAATITLLLDGHTRRVRPDPRGKP